MNHESDVIPGIKKDAPSSKHIRGKHNLEETLKCFKIKEVMKCISKFIRNQGYSFPIISLNQNLRYRKK